MANKKVQRQKKHLAFTVLLVGEMIEINRKGLLVLLFIVIATLEKALAFTNPSPPPPPVTPIPVR